MADSDEFDSLSSAAVPGIDEAPPDGQAPAGTAATLREQLEQAQRDAAQQRDLYLRALADFENFKRRAERETASRADGAKRSILLRLLDVVDNFERAAAYRETGTPPDQLVDGLLATVKQLRTLLDTEGIKRIEVTGKPFDPKVSEAVGTRETPGRPPNIVLDEARKGYTMGEELLRPAQVIVSTTAD